MDEPLPTTPTGAGTGGGPGGLPPEFHTPPVESDHGRAGRNLPAAIGVGVALVALVVATLVWFHWGFVLVVAIALALGAVEVYQALRRLGMNAAIQPIAVGTLAVVIGSYMAAERKDIPTNTFMLAALSLTVLAALVWRMPGGQDNFVKDAAASLFVIGYVPLLGSFVALMMAGERGTWRFLTMLAIVVASDTGGYIVGVLFGKHPMAPRISPKKSWEGLAGSVGFGVAAGILMAVFTLNSPFWVGLILGILLVAAGVAGDLIESLVKRDVGIKDMSSFLPGHGGIMDRLDSLLVAAPVAWLLMYLMVPGG